MRVCAGNSDTDVEIVEIDEMGVVNGVRERRGTRLRGECCVEGEGVACADGGKPRPGCKLLYVTVLKCSSLSLSSSCSRLRDGDND